MLWIKDVFVREGQIGLIYRNGQYVRMATPGRYSLVHLPWLREEITPIDMRQRLLTMQGQEMLTGDGFPVRLNVTATYRVVDAPRAVHTAVNYEIGLYNALQIILRDEVQARSLDAVLADRGVIARTMQERGAINAAELGLELITVGVKDIILSSEIKKMLAQEVEAQRAGRTALVAAREETAAMRAKANTARLLAESPALLKMQEWEALTKMAQGYGKVVYFAVPLDAANLPAARSTAEAMAAEEANS